MKVRSLRASREADDRIIQTVISCVPTEKLSPSLRTRGAMALSIRGDESGIWWHVRGCDNDKLNQAEPPPALN